MARCLLRNATIRTAFVTIYLIGCLYAQTCPAGFSWYGEKCYKLVTTQTKTFSAAYADCRRIGAILVEPRTETEHDDIVALARTHSPFQKTWLGASDQRQHQTWRWWTGDANMSWTNWNGDQPQANDEHCMGWWENDYKWHDLLCNCTYSYMCQACHVGKWQHPGCGGVCHCQDTTEACDILNSSCPSGCAVGRKEPDCQTDAITDVTSTSDTTVNPDAITDATSTSDNTVDPVSTTCDLGKYGDDCSKDCHCKYDNETCNKQTGSCPSGCDLGWTGPDCQTSTKHCKVVNNTCVSDCQPGWKGTECRQIDCSHDDWCGNHTCNEVGEEYTCTCKQGYENKSPHECGDINECLLDPTLCSIHTCIDTEGSFHCKCLDDTYVNVLPDLCVAKLTAEPETFKPTHASLFFLEEIEVRIAASSLSGLVILFLVLNFVFCAKTALGSLFRFIFTKPVAYKVVFVCDSEVNLADLDTSDDDDETTLDDDFLSMAGSVANTPPSDIAPQGLQSLLSGNSSQSPQSPSYYSPRSPDSRTRRQSNASAGSNASSLSGKSYKSYKSYKSG